MKRIVVAVFIAAAAAVFGEAPEPAILYSGKLKKGDGSAVSTDRPLDITFRLYKPNGDSLTLVYAREIPVKFSANGAFAVEIKDSVGAAVDGASASTLKAAVLECAQAQTSAKYPHPAYLTIQPQGGHEIEVKMPLTSQPFALHATSADKVKNLKARTIEATDLTLANADIDTLNLKNGAVSLSEVTFKPHGSLVVSASQKLQLNGGISGIQKYSYSDEKRLYTLKSDAIFLTSAERTPCSLVLPAGTEQIYPKAGIIYTFGKQE